MSGYEKSSTPLGSVIEYVDPETKFRWIFPVPEEYKGMKNIILVTEHPDYSLEVIGNDRIVRAAKVDLIERFPAKHDSYLTDIKHGIPFGDPVADSDSSARKLFRFDTRSVSFSIRDCDYVGYNNRYIALGDRLSHVLGVAVEAPDAHVASDMAPIVRSAEQSGRRATKKVK
jgi:hypothetical protein